MENNVALNLRDIANQVNDEIEARKVAEHKAFIEERILPFLQERAQQGKYNADFSTQGYNPSRLRELLIQLGFTVEIRKFSGGWYLFVKW